MRNFGFLEILIVVLTVLVILGIFTVVLALMYPSATKGILADIRQVFGPRAKSPVVVIVRSITIRAQEGFNYRIRPFLEGFASRFSGGPPKKVSEKEKKLSFDNCTKCHKSLFEQKAFNRIFIDHRLHDAVGVKCQNCHQDTSHPKPVSVSEKTCLQCHKQRRATTACNSCHPPGSILSEDVIPKERTAQFLSGIAVSTKVLVPQGFEHPTGDRSQYCRQCHAVSEFCDRCHLVFHNTEPNWVPTHGPRILAGEFVMNTCWTCHNATWCAGTCHSNAPNRERKTQPWAPLPSVPLEPYEQRFAPGGR